MRFTTRKGTITDMADETLTKDTKKIHLNYTTAKFYRRAFANLTDFIIFVLVFVGLFLATRAIVMATPSYQETAKTYLNLRLESGLYMPKDDDCQDTVAYLSDTKNNYSGYAKKNLAKEGIDNFFLFTAKYGTPAVQKEIQDDYDAYRLKDGFSYEGVAYFVKSGDQIVENPDCKASHVKWFENVYAPYINTHLHGYLISRFPAYLELTKFETKMLVWAEITPAYLVAGFLVYYIPPLFFRRGRMTLGKAMYRVGLADKRLLSCTLGRYSARFAIWYFAELCLSPFTFGLPFLISASLMAFSKGRQGFPDYMLGLHEVDLTKDKLYFSYAEISLNAVSGGKEALNFRNTYID